MKRLAAILPLLALAACGQQEPGEPVMRTEIGSGALRQLTRSEVPEATPAFMADGRVMYRVGADWIVHDLGTGLAGPIAMVKAEKDPAEVAKADDLRDMQLRLIATLAQRNKSNTAKAS